MRALTIVFAVVWAVVAVLEWRRRSRRAAGAAAPALGHALAVWPPLAPLVLAGWAAYALTLPDARASSRARRSAVALACAASLGWALVQAAQQAAPSGRALAVGAGIVVLAGTAAAGSRYRTASGADARVLLWTGAAGLLAGAAVVVEATVRILTDRPASLGVWAAAAALSVPIAHVIALAAETPAAAERAFSGALGTAAVAGTAAASYLVAVGGIADGPHGSARTVSLAGMVAAAAAATLAVPARLRAVGYARAVLGRRPASTVEVVETFEARMTRALPLDELLLQLAESLRSTVPGTHAEIWTGSGAALTPAISVPARARTTLRLDEPQVAVVAQTRVGGPAWIAVWLPELHQSGGDERVAPIAHLGELLGLVVVRRPAQAAPFTDADDAALATIARKLGLALHNVRLDSALQASLAELAERNAELQASRLRIVNAADATRREIERNLHDGAQQHLVSLAVKLGVARELLDDPVRLRQLMDDVHQQAQATIGALRELAHGIYPPLLRDRGLGAALDAAADRSPVPTNVALDLPGRYPEQVETAAYFCCLEAMQNAAKYAGAGATVRVSGRDDGGVLEIEVADDGAGFDTASVPAGHGFTNMQDRLGALGGSMSVTSGPGRGTTVRLRIPSSPR